jgi:hypothetical protein
MKPIMAGKQDTFTWTGMGVAKISTRDKVATVESMLAANVTMTMDLPETQIHHPWKLPGLGVGGLGATKDDNRYKCEGNLLTYQTSAARDLHATSTVTLSRVGMFAGGPILADMIKPKGPPLPSPTVSEYPEGTPVCGPEIGEKLKRVLNQVPDDWNKLGRFARAGQCMTMGFWDIGVLRKNPWELAPSSCKCNATSACRDTVRVNGFCHRAGIVNYSIYGVIERICHARFLGEALHQGYVAGKVISGTVGASSGTTAEITKAEQAWVAVGYQFVDSGLLKGLPDEDPAVAVCKPCTCPVKPHYGWRYTWMFQYTNEPVR